MAEQAPETEGMTNEFLVARRKGLTQYDGYATITVRVPITLEERRAWKLRHGGWSYHKPVAPWAVEDMEPYRILTLEQRAVRLFVKPELEWSRNEDFIGYKVFAGVESMTRAVAEHIAKTIVKEAVNGYLVTEDLDVEGDRK
jgi:predicted metal-binding protein